MKEDFYQCRFCFEDFTEEERDKLIVPCACTGSGKYVCKDCLNKYIETDKTDEKFNVCPSCKKTYKREVPDISDSINHQVKDEMLYGVGFLTLILTSFIFLGKFNSIFFLMLLFVYLITAFHLGIYSGNNENITWYIMYIIIFYSLIFISPHKIGYIGFVMWSIILYGYFSYKILNNGWNLLFKTKYNKTVENLQCLMFDYDLGEYVSGVL